MDETRAELRRHFRQAALGAGEALERQQRAGVACDLYRAALRLDPTADAVYRRLMLCLQAAGQMAEAADVFERCEEIMAERLGLGPSRATVAVYDSVVDALRQGAGIIRP